MGFLSNNYKRGEENEEGRMKKGEWRMKKWMRGPRSTASCGTGCCRWFPKAEHSGGPVAVSEVSGQKKFVPATKNGHRKPVITLSKWKPLLLVVGCLLTLPAAAATPPADLARQVAAIEHERILRLAREVLASKPLSIADQVATNSAGGPHDFFSQADYSWPNPKSTNGLPYVDRDGYSNPNTFTYHRLAMRQMKDAVAALAAAYALTGEDRYVAKAAEFLRVFFLDAQTRMNPNLQYAQAVLGSSTGRSYGIIDTLHLAELPVAIRFLEKSPAFPPAVDLGMKRWFADYTHWIMTSTNGVKEMNAGNNHSIACFVQLASFAKLTGDNAVLDLARRRFKEVLLPRQMTNDGSFPLELKRSKPYGYSIFQADNVSILCHLLSTKNNDLWKFTLPDGRGPRQAVDFIYPFLANKNRWLAAGHAPDVAHWDAWPVRQPCLLFAYAEFGDEKFFTLWNELNADPVDSEIRRNMAVTQPLLWVASPEEIPFDAPHLQDMELANYYKTNGIIFFEFQQWDNAISNFQKCVAINTNDTLAYDGLAAAYFVKRDVDDAIINYTHELEIDPTRAMAWLNQGNAWLARGEYDSAITDFDACLRLNLTNSMVYKLRALAWNKKGDHDREIADLTECLRQRPWDVSVVLMRADAYAAVGQFKAAVADYQQAIQSDPQNLDAINDYAWFRATCPEAEVRNGQLAVLAATKACALTGFEKWELLDTLAAAYAEAGDFSQATNYERQAMAKVLTSDPAKQTMLQHELVFEMHQPWRE
jgi:tetratricopeptide (TPR) repeat protein